VLSVKHQFFRTRDRLLFDVKLEPCGRLKFVSRIAAMTFGDSKENAELQDDFYCDILALFVLEDVPIAVS
jgi:hypothetical protein